MSDFEKIVDLLGAVVYEMENPYKKRCVGRTLIDGAIVSTCFTPDHGYETAILHNVHYIDEERDFDAVIVAYHADREAAIVGHRTWCESLKEMPKEHTVVIPVSRTEDDEPQPVTLMRNIAEDWVTIV